VNSSPPTEGTGCHGCAARVRGCGPVDSERYGSLSDDSRYRQEPIAAAPHRGDEARLSPVVLQPRPQIADLAVYDVAFGHVVDALQRVQDLLSANHSASVGRQKVEQALLDGQQTVRPALKQPVLLSRLSRVGVLPKHLLVDEPNVASSASWTRALSALSEFPDSSLRIRLHQSAAYRVLATQPQPLCGLETHFRPSGGCGVRSGAPDEPAPNASNPTSTG
jgi:hypothetical protein